MTKKSNTPSRPRPLSTADLRHLHGGGINRIIVTDGKINASS